MSFEDTWSWSMTGLALGTWVWAMVSFLRTPRTGFASGLERSLMLFLLIVTNVLGALAWFLAVRPLVRARLVEIGDLDSQPHAEPWRQHLAP